MVPSSATPKRIILANLDNGPFRIDLGTDVAGGDTSGDSLLTGLGLALEDPGLLLGCRECLVDRGSFDDCLVRELETVSGSSLLVLRCSDPIVS